MSGQEGILALLVVLGLVLHIPRTIAVLALFFVLLAPDSHEKKRKH